MKDMQEAEVLAPCEKMHLSYHDKTVRGILFNKQEVPFPDGKLIVSRTDLAGVITHCNQSFVDMSGYSREELIGEPHHILRHPDMPRNGMVMSKTCVRMAVTTGYMPR